MERRRNSPETKEWVRRQMAEEKYNKQLQKLAKRAIVELGWGLERL
jgi:hypothetical protein